MTRIRFRLLALAAVSVLPFVVFLLHSVEDRREDNLRNAKQQVENAARLLAFSQSRIFTQSREILAGLAFSTEQVGITLQDPHCRRRMSRLLEIARIYSQAAIFDIEGNPVCSARPLSQAVNIKDRDYFQRALATARFAMSGLVVNRDTGAPSLIVAQPLFDRQDGVVAVLVAAINLASIQELFKEVSLPHGASASLVDGDGTIFAHSPDLPGFMGTKIPDLEEFTRTSASNSTGFTSVIDRQGVERIAAYARITAFPEAHFFARVGFSKSAADLTARTGVLHGNDEIGRLAATLDMLASNVQRTTRAFKALSAGNRTILREDDEGSLLRAMCDVAVAKAGYRLAFVNYAQKDDRKSVASMACAGMDDGFIDTLELTWADTERGQGTVGTAIRTGAHCIVRSIANDPRFQPWRDEALKRGYGSIVSFPLTVEEGVLGTFTLIAAEEDAFDDDELALLDELAADLSFGISGLRSRHRRNEAERQVKRTATHDMLTGLPNAAGLLARLPQEISAAGTGNQALAVLVVHLSRLQDVYDSLGYGPGNAIVREVAGRLRTVSDCGGSLARISPEDFAVLLPKTDARRAAMIAERISAVFRAAVKAGDVQVDFQAALGASYYPGHGDDADLLLRRASIAARDAARKGMSYLPYQGVTERESPARLAIAAELRVAVEQRSLVLHYQPKLDLRTNRISGCEALVRWPHRQRGMISPGEFIPIAEQTGLIHDMTYLVLELAASQQRTWRSAGNGMPIAVNLSVRNLHDPGLLQRVDELRATWGLPPESLEFEITESALMEEPAVAKAAIAGLRATGSKIYIDDFGTGYSSLSYLVSLPVHSLKVDRSFVAGMTKSREAHSLVTSVVSMAHALALRVVAEGVETSDELEQLRCMGCDEAQGYYIGRPVPAESFQSQLGLKNEGQRQ
jgi:diguanylate cyclase (GGDEF)-like protein